MRKLVVAAAAALALGGKVSAQGVDINAPLDTRPTIHTEIQRGFTNARNQCAITLEPLSFAECIDKLSSAGESELVSADAYNLGVYLGGWQRLDIIMKADGSMPDNAFAAASLPEAKHQAASMFDVARGLQKKMGLTDAQLLNSTGTLPGSLNDRWAYWLSQPYSEMAK